MDLKMYKLQTEVYTYYHVTEQLQESAGCVGQAF